MPVRNPNDAVEVEAGIAHVFGAPPEERASAIRQLFVEALDFNPDRGEVSLGGAPAGVELPETADRLATLDGVNVLHVALQAPATGRVRKADVSAAARIIAEQFGDNLLLVLTNAGASQLHFVRPDLSDARPRLRRMIVERDLPQRTAVEQIAGIYWKHQETGSLPTALDRAFDVEPVTKEFFKEYKRVFRQAEESVSGFADEEGADKRLFVQTLFNRLMFIYFLQRKGWLDFRGDKNYLRALWDDYRRDRREKDNFYLTRLTTLFFVGLNNPDSRDLTAGTEPLIGRVPFLNGGLFELGDLDKRKDLTVPDEAIEPVLTDLFERFNFTVMESTPFDIEVAVDPEMLGKVFEELVTGRQESGSYYTPRDVVSYMCREALKGYLEVRGTGLPPAVIAAFVDEHRTAGIDVAAARKVAAALDEVTVVDPACGSGAYLLGMMQELVELQTVLFNAGADDKSLHTLKLEIIERNLRGVDIDPFAIHIAQLRLWLSLTIEYDGPPPVPPLPNLDLGIVTGDSLLVAHLSARDLAEGGVQGALGDHAAELQKLKARYMRESAGPAKAALRARVDEVNRALRERYGGSGVVDAGGGVEWRSAFPEVFEPGDGRGGGFDIVIANPPYHQLQRDGGRLADLYRDVRYRTFAPRGDIYQLFYERGCELLKPDGGVLAYITSNSWLRAEYGKKLRAFFAERHTPLRWLDLGKDVFDSAIVDSGVLLLRSGGEAAPFPAVDMDRLPDVGFPPADDLWGYIGPDAAAPWSILSRTEQSVMEKMRAVGTPLAEWDDVGINYGIKTGYNAAFVIDTTTRDALVAEDPKSAEIIRPLLRGRDIRRWRAEWAGYWLIYSHSGVQEHDYPAVRKHLVAHQDRLRGRRGGANPRTGAVPYEWWQLQVDYYNSGTYRNFAKPKLLWATMSPEGRFSYSDADEFCNQKGYVLTGASLKYLAAVLNSALVTWFMEHTAFTTGMGLIQWERLTVAPIPVPRIGDAEQRPFVELVDLILAAKDADADADTEEWERAIDRLVYDLYGLSEEEDTTVERALGLIHSTDEAEDAAILRSILDRPEEDRELVSRDALTAALRASNGG